MDQWKGKEIKEQSFRTVLLPKSPQRPQPQGAALLPLYGSSHSVWPNVSPPSRSTVTLVAHKQMHPFPNTYNSIRDKGHGDTPCLKLNKETFSVFIFPPWAVQGETPSENE